MKKTKKVRKEKNLVFYITEKELKIVWNKYLLFKRVMKRGGKVIVIRVNGKLEYNQKS